VPAALSLVIDCRDPETLALFWTQALGYTNVGLYGSYAVLVDPDNASPRLLLQRVSEPKPGKNRVHFDVHVADVHAEAARLESLGAVRGETLNEFGTDWVVMADPEGNEFCVCSSDA